MANFYLGSIDLNKIKKENIQAVDKEGNPFKNGAKYLNISVWVNEEADQYGNHVSVKAGTKDDSYYIGNAKKWDKNGNSGASEGATDDDDSLPF